MRAVDQPREGHFCPNCGYNRAPDPILEAAGWRVDPRNREAIFGSKRVHFTPAELTIFHSLLAANGETVRRDVLMERIGSDADSNSLQVLLARVRRKISGTPVEILSLRGHGLRAVESVPA